jgi:hypothetical protein
MSPSPQLMKQNQMYCPGFDRSGEVTSAETVMAAPPSGWDTRGMATRTGMQSPALHVADSHDLVRVHGAFVNNLRASASRSRSAG